MFEIEDLITVWNDNVKGYWKTVRVKKPFYEKSFLKIFNEAQKEIPNISQWQLVIEETLRLFDEDPEFWNNRRGKHGLIWLFQKRLMGKGEVNWIYYYEKAMDRIDNEASKMSLNKQYFSN